MSSRSLETSGCRTSAAATFGRSSTTLPRNCPGAASEAWSMRLDRSTAGLRIARSPATIQPALVRLPAMDATPIERVASPAEFANLLATLPLAHALPYGLAGYGMGRRAQMVRLRWEEVDLKIGAIEWGVEWEARKYE